MPPRHLTHPAASFRSSCAHRASWRRNGGGDQGVRSRVVMSSAPSGEEGAKAKTRDASGRSGGRGNTDRDSAQEEEVRRIEQCNLFYMFENRPKCPCVTAFLLRSYRAVSTHAPRPCNGSVLPSVIRILGALMLNVQCAQKRIAPFVIKVPLCALCPPVFYLLATYGRKAGHVTFPLTITVPDALGNVCVPVGVNNSNFFPSSASARRPLDGSADES